VGLERRDGCGRSEAAPPTGLFARGVTAVPAGRGKWIGALNQPMRKLQIAGEYRVGDSGSIHPKWAARAMGARDQRGEGTWGERLGVCIGHVSQVRSSRTVGAALSVGGDVEGLET
jgi:hypothetical protein